MEAFPTAAGKKERTRADGVDADVVRCQFPRECASEEYFSRFGCAVLRTSVCWFPAGDGRDGDNTATISFLHVRNSRATGANRVKKVEVKGLLPVGVCGGEQVARSRCTSHIVDEDINAAECICGCIDKSLGFAGFGHIERESECLDVVCANFFEYFVNACLPARTQGDIATFCGKSQCGCATNAATAPGDEGDFIGEIEVHGQS